MGGLVGSAPACYGSSLGSKPDISQKIQRQLPSHFSPTKKRYKKLRKKAAKRHFLGVFTILINSKQ
jgi:hypothetical protein